MRAHDYSRVQVAYSSFDGLSGFASLNRLTELQSDALAAANAELAPDGRVAAL